jgi:lysophospholipase L1-like esterase
LAAPSGNLGAIAVEANHRPEDHRRLLSPARAHQIMVGAADYLQPEKPEFAGDPEPHHKLPLVRDISRPCRLSNIELERAPKTIMRMAPPRITRHCIMFALLIGGPGLAKDRPAADWVGAWGFPPNSFVPTPVPPNPASRTNASVPDFNDVTVRQIVRISAQAKRVRIRLSNEFADKPLRLGSVHVALAAEDGATVSGSDHVVTFSGRAAATIPAHAPMLSDPIDWALPALTKLTISVHLPEDTVPPAHRVSEYISSPGDFTAAQRMPGSELVRTGALVSEVDIQSPRARRVVVTLGDSITEGFGSAVNEFRGWPDRLADRLSKSAAANRWSLVNLGINSNRLLHDGPGDGALARFDRDVLSVSGVSMVLLLEGINDIGYSRTVPAQAVTAADIVGAYSQLIGRAHEHGIAVVAGTIPPFENSHYYDAAGEQTRQAVNRWIRTSGAFDGIVDFDSLLRDPAHPTQVKEALQRGDHLHPNDAGYAAMGDAIDLKLFERDAINGLNLR